MIWGTFHIRREVHSAPCNARDILLIGHDLAWDCPCMPTPNWEPGWKHVLWTHHDDN